LSVEGGEYSVAGSSYFSSPGRAKLRAERGVIVAQHLVPATVAQQRGFLGRADDVNKEHSGTNATGLDARLHRTVTDAYRCR
jgi:hypothetical protein